ncbi:MAG: hypothetical protein ACRYGG_13170 [Janthinobacterium lividum]
MRKEKTIVVELANRDQGKHFYMKEMSAIRAEKWAARALLALSRSRIDITPDVVAGGLAAIATVGIQALSGLQFHEAEPLMDEMFSCIQFMPNPAQPAVKRPLVEDDIDDVATLTFLRAELIALHVGFSLPASLWTSISGRVTGETTSTTSTSPEALAA